MAEGPTLASLDAGKMTAAEEMRSILAEAGGMDGETISDAPSAPEPPAGASIEPSDADTGKTAAERARDERGRFTKAEQDAVDKAAGKTPAPGEKKAESESEGDHESIDETVAEDDVDPPHDRPLEWQTEFRKLPPALRKFVLDADKTSREVTAERSRYQAFESIFAPRRQAWAMQGLSDDAAAIKALLATSDYVDQHPAEFIQQLMEAKGLQFAPPQQQQQDPAAGDYDDPVIKALQTELQATRSELNQIKQGLQGQTQAQRQHEVSEARNALVSFQNEKDERGRLKHPYMSDPNVRSLMSAMLRSGRAPDHIKAYEMACHADPEVRAKIAAAAKADEERARAAEQRKKAEAAQRSGSSISGSPAGPTIGPDLSGKSARDDMRQIAAEMGYRLG